MAPCEPVIPVSSDIGVRREKLFCKSRGGLSISVMLMERIDILLSSDSVENSSRGQSASHMNITHCRCELQVTERLIYFVFSEIRENQIPGDRIEELCRDLCMGPQAVP